MTQDMQHTHTFSTHWIHCHETNKDRGSARRTFLSDHMSRCMHFRERKMIIPVSNGLRSGLFIAMTVYPGDAANGNAA